MYFALFRGVYLSLFLLQAVNVCDGDCSAESYIVPDYLRCSHLNVASKSLGGKCEASDNAVLCDKTIDGNAVTGAANDWYSAQNPAKDSFVKITFGSQFLINTIRVMQRGGTNGQYKGIRLEFSDGNYTKIELDRNVGADHEQKSEWNVRTFEDVTTSWVKVVIETEYANSNNGFKEIEFYHNNCDRDNLCDSVKVPNGEFSRARSVHGKTVKISKIASEKVTVRLSKEQSSPSNYYDFVFDTSKVDILRMASQEASGNIPIVPGSSATSFPFWIDLRSSRLVVGYGDKVIVEWKDPNPFDMSYITFKVDGGSTPVHLCNRKDKCHSDADHYWPLDKITAGSVFDLNGQKHGNTLITARSQGPPIDRMLSSSLAMNTAQHQRIDFGDFGGTCFSDLSHCGDGLTVMFWVYVPDSVSTTQVMLASSSLSDRGFYVKYISSNSSVVIQTTDAYLTALLSVKIKKAVWYHIAFTYTRTYKKLKVIVNGVRILDVSAVTTGLNEKSTKNIFAGQLPSGSGTSVVHLSNVAMWKKPFNLEEMGRRFHCANFFLDTKDCVGLTNTIPCGWSGITSADCLAIGCCYSAGVCKNVVQNMAKLGVGSGAVSYFNIKASSETSGYQAMRGRLTYTHLSESWSDLAWIPLSTDANPYLQMDLYQVLKVGGVATKGLNAGSKPYVKTFTLSYGKSGVNWQMYLENNAVKVFTGNTDETTVKMNNLSPTILARGVRIHPKSWETEAALQVELFGEKTADNYVGCSKDVAFEAAGDYDFSSLTPEKCTTNCGLAQYTHAALKKGKECYCAKSVDNSKLVGDSHCDEPCSGNLILRCGGVEHFSVYETKGSYGGSLGLSIPQQQKAFETFNVTFASFPGATFKVDFGENLPISSQTLPVTYMYHSTGNFIVVGETTNGEYGEPQILVTAKEVNVYAFPEEMDLKCPSSVEANVEFFCEITVYQGSNLTLETQFTGSPSPLKLSMDDGHALTVGEIFSTNDLEEEAGGITVLIPAYHFEDDGRHVGWEVYVEKTGYITLQIYRPVCGRGADNKHCYVNGTCQTAVATCNNRRAVTCSSGETFSTASSVCAPNNVQPLRPTVPTPDDTYELISENHVYLSSRGRHLFHFTGSLKNNISTVMKGDIVGYYLPVSGFAQLVSRNASKSDAFNVEELIFDGAFSLGDVFSTVTPPPKVLDAQRSLIAFHQVPSQFMLSHNYSIGVYTEEISVRGSNNVISDTARIVATQSVSGLNWTHPQFIATNETFDIIVHPHPGYNVSYVMSYSGDNLTDFKTSLTSDLHFTYTFKKRGEYRVTLLASNALTYVFKACTINVQDTIKNVSFYIPIKPMPLNNVTTVDWLMRQGSSVNITVDFGDGTTLDNGTFDVAYLWVATYSHVYAAIGEYPVIINVSNMVSNASIEGLAVVELPIEGFDFTVVHSARDIEVNETITVQMSTTQGTNPEFLVDFGDGSITTSRDMAVTHSYSPYNLYNISVWASNNVSDANVTHEIKVHKPVEDLIGFNITCPPTNLTDATPCMLNITMGTDFRCTWVWGDGLENETTSVDLGNFTYHNYSSVGHFQVSVNCTNRLYNTTTETVAIVERPILEFTVDPPEGRPFDQDFTVTSRTLMGTDAIFNITFTHVISGTTEIVAITSLTSDTTLCTALISKSKFPVIGIYELNVTVVNYVTPRQVIILPVYIDIPIANPSLTRLYEFFILKGPAPFEVEMTAGSNVTLQWDYGDGEAFSEFFIGEFPVDGTSMTHAYQQQGAFCTELFGNNSVSNFTLQVCTTIQGPTNVTTLSSNSPQAIPPGVLSFDITTMPGEVKPENVTYSIDFGDGQVDQEKELIMPLNINHTYATNGAYLVNVSIKNEVSNTSMQLEVELQTPIEGLQLIAVHSDGDAGFGSPGCGPENNYFPLDYPVMFSSPITNGTNVTYTWSFALTTTEPQVNYTFSEPKKYIVSVTASNAVNEESLENSFVLQRIVKGVTFKNDGPTKIGSITTFTLAMEQFGTDACYFVQLENGTTYLYKEDSSTSCASHCPTSENVKIGSSLITIEHKYKAVDMYEVKVVGCNMVSKIEIETDAACVDKPCSYPNVTIDPETAGPNVTAPISYLKSVPLKVKAEIEIRCEASDVSKLEWEVCKLESDLKTCLPVALPSDVTTNARELKLPKRTLEYGLHIFKFTVTMVGVKGIYTEGEGYVDIKPSDIEAQIAGGTSKAVGYGLSITLDASTSLDPDLTTHNHTGMEFYWFCAKKGEGLDEMMDENATSLPALPVVPLPIANGTNVSQVLSQSKGCFGYGPGRLNVPGMQFTFNTSRTMIDGIYEVRVLVTKDTRSSSYTMMLHVKEGDPPDVTIHCKIGCEGRKKINPSEKLTFEGSAVCGTCAPGQQLNYLWKVSEQTTSGEWQEVTDPLKFLATPLSGKNAVVRPNVLEGGILYQFKLFSWIPSAKTRGFSEIVREVNKPPAVGKCELTPPKGFTMKTNFNVTCKDWFDKDSPLDYTLLTVDADGSESQVRSWSGSKDAANEVVRSDGFTLPEGSGEGGNLTVVVEVSDTEGSVSRYTLFVQVERPKLDKGAADKLLEEGEKNLQLMLSQGNTEAAMAAISNMASFMSGSDTEPEKEEVDEAAAAAAEAAAMARMDNLMNKMMDIPVTDPKGAANKAGTIASLLKDPSKLSDDAKANAASALEDSAKMLSKGSPGETKKLSKSLVNGIGPAVPKSPSKEATTGSKVKAKPVNVTAQKLMSEKLQKSVSMIKSATLNNLATDEEPEVVTSPSLSMAVAKKSAKDLAAISSGGSSFKGLGNAVQNNNSDESVGIESAAFTGNPFAYANGSDDVTGGVSEISLKYENGTPMVISNLETPFEMIMENKDPPKPDVHQFTLNSVKTLKITVVKNRSAILVQVHPQENNTQITVCVKKGAKASSNFGNCDFIQVIPSFGSGNDSSVNPYSMQIPAASHNYSAAGPWYASFKYNGTFGTTEGSDAAPEESNCTVYIFEASCIYMNETTGVFESDGMMVGPQTTPTQTHCLAYHMTSFASDFVVAPNKIDFSKVNLTELLNNPLVFCVVMGFFALYGILCVWARRADRKDQEKLGVTPLQDNDPRDTYMYEIVVYTGFNSHAGTTSEIRMVLAGGLDETSPRLLRDPDPTRRKFCRGSVDYFLLGAPRCLGKLKTLRIWHDNTGADPSWYLLRIMVHDLQSDVKTWFICDRWMAVEEDDGMVDRTLVPASKEELTSFNLLFSTEARKNLSDNHLWFSVIARPVKSNFTRIQRLTCCLSVLMSTMLANAMFYKVDDKSSTGTSVHLGPISFSVKQLSIAIQSSLVVLPANILIVTMFRKARPAEPKKEGLDKDQDPHGQSQKYEFTDEKADKDKKEDDNEKDNDKDNDKGNDKKKKKKATLPHYFVYVAYALAFVATTTTGAFTVFYGLTFGSEKSAKWMSTMMLSFWQDVLISQPLKVFAAAMFFALVIKDPNKAEEENEQNNELTPDEEAIHKDVAENDEEKTIRKLGFISKPPDPEKLEAARQLKLKQKAMKQIIREMITYFLFLSVLLIVAYGNRDPIAFKVTEAIRSVIQESDYTGTGGFEDSSDANSFWGWAMTSFIPTLKPRYWYGPVVQFNQNELLELDVTKSRTVIRLKKKNKKKWVNVNGNYVKNFEVLHKYKEGYVADRETAHLVGSPRLRILRIKKDKCKIINMMTPFFKDCMAQYDWDYEDQDNYHPKWIAMAANETVDEKKEATPWQYQSAWKLKGTPYWGTFATYWGGGYVADFGADRDKSEALAKELQPLHWIDRYTRAIFSEFTVYNAPTNFFCVVTFLMEILPTGGYYPNSKIQTLRLYRYIGPEMVIVVACEIMYITFLLHFLYRQVKKYRKEGRKVYFSDGWNYLEFLVLFFSIFAVTMYFMRMAVTKYTISNMQETPDRFVSFQYAAFLDEWVTALTSLAVFFSILKFLRLLRFNKRVALVVQTIKLSVSPLLSFFLMFFVIFFAYAQFAFIIFGIHSDSYASFPNTLSSMLSLTLGSFDFQEMRSINRLLGPAFFFSFVVVMFFVLMNVFISILSDAFNEVNSDLAKQSNEHELLDFMFNSFKRTVGKQVAPDIKPKYKEPKNQFELNMDSIEEMSENIEYAMRNLVMEDIRQSNWFDSDAASKKKKVLIRMLLETDEDFTENDICDSIPLFDKLLAKNSEKDLIETLVYFREWKKREDALSLGEKNSQKGDSDDDSDDDSPDDGDPNDDDDSDELNSDAEIEAGNPPIEGAIPGRITSLEDERIMDEIVVLHSRAQSRVNSPNPRGSSQV